MSAAIHEHEHVAIFWDYENCSPPSTAPGYDIMNNIREIAHRFGSVKQFKAYLELSEQSSPKSMNLRSELQSCGVSLTDCPHNGRKEVADKMMMVDMLTYAIDTPAPATLLLITGDRDFVYAVSVLRLRRYRVVLVAPNATHASLKSQASEVLDWDCDILGKAGKDAHSTTDDSGLLIPGPGVDLHRRTQSASVLIGQTSQSGVRNPRRLSFRENLSGATLTSEQESGRTHSTFVDRGTSPRFASRTVDVPRSAPQTPVRSSGCLLIPGSKTVETREIKETILEDTEPIPDLNVHLKNFQERSLDVSSISGSSLSLPSTPSITGQNETPVVLQPLADTPQNVTSVKDAPAFLTSPAAHGNCSSPALATSTPLTLSTTPSPALNQVQEPSREPPAGIELPARSVHEVASTKTVSPNSTRGTSEISPTVLKDDSSSLVGSVSSLPLKPPMLSPGWSIATQPAPVQLTLPSQNTPITQGSNANGAGLPMAPKPIAVPVDPPAPTTTAPRPTSIPAHSQPGAPECSGPSVKVVVGVSPPPQATASCGDSSALPVQSESSSELSTVHVLRSVDKPSISQPGPPNTSDPSVVSPAIPSAAPTPPPVQVLSPVPAHYNVLLVVLERCRMIGNLQPSRHNVAMMLMKEDPDAYKRAGFKKFKQYTTYAQSIGMVTLGGAQASAWMSLSPSWYGKAVGV
ncbi:hypothetical protein SCP_0408370 [Sparassis crispa]|uniref:NYN domain-containing protein n=1 Tax=Sparassis crispa TaxID=139825 RepID=A0A401GJW7_9APHY|nr:hypothetical protein SCP_0408370 [Sparassis crispa]GBE82453.1 hypothetical protein SCP_0408370 [Sparassis crispa]